MGDGFAVGNHHTGGIRSNLGYYIRNKEIGASYIVNMRGGFDGYEFSSGEQIGGGTGVALRVLKNAQMQICSDDFYVRSESGTPRLLITQDAANDILYFTQYSPDGNTEYIRKLTGGGAFTQENTGDYSISSDTQGWFFSDTTLSIGTNDVDSTINIGKNGHTTLTGVAENIYSGTGGISMTLSNAANISATVTATGDININTNGPNGIVLTDSDIGSGGTRTINLGGANTITRMYLASTDSSNGGANMPTNGPNNTTTAAWIPVQNLYFGNYPMYIFFVY